MIDLCPHDGDPHSCPPCQRSAGRITDPAPVAREWSFVARYEGQCPSCDLPINVGDRASKWTDGRTRHESCTP